MLWVLIPILVDPTRYPAMRAVPCLAVEDWLWWILGHVVTDLGLIRTAPLENLVKLPKALGHTALFEMLAILADVGCAAAIANCRAKYVLVLGIELRLQDADRVSFSFGAHATLRKAGLIIHSSPSCTKSI
jgi:hypothetical protein